MHRRTACFLQHTVPMLQQSAALWYRLSCLPHELVLCMQGVVLRSQISVPASGLQCMLRCFRLPVGL